MADTPALTRAQRCFAVARSTTFPAERDAAIALGIAIATAAGLSLSAFDIPGRAAPGHDGTAPGHHWTAADVADMAGRHYGIGADSAGRWGACAAEAVSTLGASIDRLHAAAGVREGETLDDARIRNFHVAAAAARARDAARDAARSLR